ncbi:MAG: hypothetical protein J7M38_05130 [Armatimonadetes bacterium]|nr:hypothetical protein [Armatimonadota bacterium]
MNTRLSPNYTVDDWRRLDFTSEEDWSKAIDIFRDRIDSRFLLPVQAMLDDPRSAASCGFAVLAVDCLLIETLQAFREGTHKTEQRSENAFVEFLTTSPDFKSYFDDGKARLFYKHFRCGILHQAETYGDSLVKSGSCHPMVARSPSGKSLVINRDRFHSALVAHVERYARELREESGTDGPLRRAFRSKMNAVCNECA